MTCASPLPRRSEKKRASEKPDEKELKKKEKQRLEKEKKELKEKQEREKKEQKEREKKENEMKKKFNVSSVIFDREQKEEEEVEEGDWVAEEEGGVNVWPLKPVRIHSSLWKSWATWLNTRFTAGNTFLTLEILTQTSVYVAEMLEQDFSFYGDQMIKDLSVF